MERAEQKKSGAKYNHKYLPRAAERKRGNNWCVFYHHHHYCWTSDDLIWWDGYVCIRTLKAWNVFRQIIYRILNVEKSMNCSSWKCAIYLLCGVVFEIEIHVHVPMIVRLLNEWKMTPSSLLLWWVGRARHILLHALSLPKPSTKHSVFISLIINSYELFSSSLLSPTHCSKLSRH